MNKTSSPSPFSFREGEQIIKLKAPLSEGEGVGVRLMYFVTITHGMTLPILRFLTNIWQSCHEFSHKYFSYRLFRIRLG